jgi:hypothetical protein
MPFGSEGYYLCKATNGIGRGLSAVIYISVQGKLSEFAVPSFNISLGQVTVIVE